MSEGFSNPIIGGAATLIRIAIQSFGYVVGVSGWQITRAGSAEFNDATIRGSISAGGGNVLLNASGLNIHSSVFGRQFDINANAGFLARLFPDDGQSLAQMLTTGTGGQVLLNAPPSASGIDLVNAQLLARRTDVGVVNVEPYTELNGLFISGFARPSIIMQGGNSILNESDINLQANTVTIFSELISNSTGMKFPAAQMFTVTINVVAGNTGVALGVTNYPQAFNVGSTLFGFANIKDASGNVRGWVPQFLPVSNTQFNCVVRNALAGGGLATMALNIDLAVFVVP
jgi:hypothetical protein